MDPHLQIIFYLFQGYRKIFGYFLIVALQVFTEGAHMEFCQIKMI